MESWIDVVPSPLFLYPTGSEIWCFWYIKTRERKIAMEKTFLLYLSVHCWDLIEQIKKKSVINTLKVLVKWNWWWNFACISTKSLNFEIYFLSFLSEIIFRCYFRQLFMYLAWKKCKNNCKILKLLWYRCPLKPEIAPSPIRFRLNFSTLYMYNNHFNWKERIDRFHVTSPLSKIQN